MCLQYRFKDVNEFQNNGTWAPLRYAMLHGNGKLVRVMTELLEDHGVDVENRLAAGDPGRMITAGSTILAQAMYFGGKEAINILLDHGADLLARDISGIFPLLVAAACDNADALEAAFRHSRCGGDRPIPS